MADTQESLTTPIVKTDEESLAQNRKYFNESSPNIYHSNPHLGSGIVGGSVAGIKSDEGEKVSINPSNFLLGLIGGSVGSKGISKAVEKASKLRLDKLSQKYPKIARNNPELFKEVFKRDIEFLARKGSYNSLTNFFNKYRLLDLNPQFFAGERTLLIGEFAPQKARLEVAKKMQQEGKSEIEIWERTGWFIGLDNKWGFEINPSVDFTKDYNHMPAQSPFQLAQILDNKDLFQAYPQLKTMSVYFKNSGNGSWYHLRDKYIIIDSKYETQALPMLYHEIQHAIQDIESFATGSGGGLQHHTLSYGEII